MSSARFWQGFTMGLAVGLLIVAELVAFAWPRPDPAPTMPSGPVPTIATMPRHAAPFYGVRADPL